MGLVSHPTTCPSLPRLQTEPGIHMKWLRQTTLAMALLASACATSPGGGPGSTYVHINDPEQLFSAADWTADVDAAVKAAGWSARAEEIKAHMNETSGSSGEEAESRALTGQAAGQNDCQNVLG